MSEEFNPNWTVHPGRTLVEALHNVGKTQKQHQPHRHRGLAVLFGLGSAGTLSGSESLLPNPSGDLHPGPLGGSRDERIFIFGEVDGPDRLLRFALRERGSASCHVARVAELDSKQFRE